jgi:GNAT superfamily N-acetyltransferase
VTVAVRRAAQADLDALLALFAENAEGDPARAPGERTHAAAILAETLADPNRTLLVAELDSEVVGTTDLLLVPSLPHGGRPWAIVENVFVTEPARRHGVGRALLARVAELAEQAGCYKLQLLSANHRASAHAFYDQIGLQPLAVGFRRYFDGTVTLEP